MKPEAENVKATFDTLQGDNARDVEKAMAEQTTMEWALLATAQYHLCGMREIAIQVARLADLAEEFLERDEGRVHEIYDLDRVARALESIDLRYKP